METSDEQIIGRLNEVGGALRAQPSVRQAVMRKVVADTVRPTRSASRLGNARRILALAACLIIASTLWNVFGSNPGVKIAGGGSSGGLGATAAFAAAFENVAKAKSFSAHQIVKQVDKDGKEETRDSIVMFKEPSFERLEWGMGTPNYTIMITDYAKHRRLMLFPNRKTGAMQDLSTTYAVDKSTGDLQQVQLDASEREQVLKIKAAAAKDLGMEKLDGKDVRVLQSEGDKEPVKKAWVDPKTNMPVQIALLRKTGSFTYASIQIDADLDPTFFSLQLPEGYKALQDGKAVAEKAPPKADKPLAEESGKMLAKMKYLMMYCIEYANDRGGTYPEKLQDLNGILKPDALKKLLAAADKPDGPSVIEYRKPGKIEKAGETIVLFESKEHRQSGKVVVGMADGHAEVMSEKRFEELMK